MKIRHRPSDSPIDHFPARLLGCFLLASLVVPPAFAQWPVANPPYQTGFPLSFVDGEAVRYSSITLAKIDAGDELPDIVVGTRDGVVEAYKGDGTKLWSYDTGAMAIEGKPAVADIDGDGFSEVVVGAGSTFTPNAHGGLYVLSHTGSLQCSFTPGDTNNDTFADGVFSSPALADLDENDGGKLEIVFGAWDFEVHVLHHDCSVYWENFTTDTVWSSPAIGDLDRDGHLEVVIGTATSARPSTGETEGGRLHVYRHDGLSELAGFPIQIDETIDSSPSLGDIDGDGWLDIVVGTGYCWDNPACAPNGNTHPVDERILAWNRMGQPLTGWPVSLPATEYAFASPSFGDLDEDGTLDVVINTLSKDVNSEGRIYALKGDGTAVTGWPRQPTTPVDCAGNTAHRDAPASPIVVDLDGDGHLEVALPSTWEVVVFDRAGNQLTRTVCPESPDDLRLVTKFGLSATPAVGDLDGDGDLELVAANADSTVADTGAIYAWDFSGPANNSTLFWPQFRRAPNNHSIVEAEAVFIDGFESGNTSRWSSVVGGF